MENGHGNSEFSPLKIVIFPTYVTVYQRVGWRMGTDSGIFVGYIHRFNIPQTQARHDMNLDSWIFLQICGSTPIPTSEHPENSS